MTQKERIYLYLRRCPEGICVNDVANDLAYTLRNRISELRLVDHLPIESEPCKAHRHRSSVARYRLVVERESATPPPLAPSAATVAARGAEPRRALALNSSAGLIQVGQQRWRCELGRGHREPDHLPPRTLCRPHHDAIHADPALATQRGFMASAPGSTERPGNE